MANNDFTEVVKSFIVITLFAFLIIGFAVSLASNYNKDTTDYQNELGLSDLNKSLQNMNTKAEGWMNSFSQQNIFNPLSVAGIVVTTTFNLAVGMWGFILTPFVLMKNIMINVLKVPPIILNIIWVLITLTIIFGIWRYVKAGY